MKAKKPLKATRVLKAKKPLRAANPVMLAGKTVAFKKRRKPTPLAKKNARQLVAVADVLFSRYIRLRDSVLNDKGEWVGGCITCTRELIVRTSEGRFVASSQNGHLISRGVMQLRFNELNCNLQCLTAQSQVNMYGNYLRSIKDVIPGDAVLAFDEQTGERTVATVIANIPIQSKTLYEVALEDGTVFQGTGDHRVFCTDGWHSLDEVLQHPNWYDIITL